MWCWLQRKVLDRVPRTYRSIAAMYVMVLDLKKQNENFLEYLGNTVRIEQQYWMMAQSIQNEFD